MRPDESGRSFLRDLDAVAIGIRMMRSLSPVSFDIDHPRFIDDGIVFVGSFMNAVRSQLSRPALGVADAAPD